MFCCRLAEKAWKLGNTVFVRTDDDHETGVLDELMWTYNDRSFLPHTRQAGNTQNAPDDETPIIIGNNTRPAAAPDLLINLGSDIPDQNLSTARIAEILNEDTAIKKLGRLRYSQYDKNKCQLHHHDMKPTT